MTGVRPSTRWAESPRPMPSSMRPPEISWRVAIADAVTVGSLVTGLVTQVPRWIVVVACAHSAKIGYGSCHRTCESQIQA